MLLRILCLSTLAASTLADCCTDLARSLGSGVESYTSGRVCHGLFWVIHGESLICHHSSVTRSWCPDRYPVALSEAESILSGTFAVSPVLADESQARMALSLRTTSSPTVDTSTVSISPPADIEVRVTPAPSTTGRRQRRVYPVSRTARSQPQPQPERVPVRAPVQGNTAEIIDVCRILHPESYETPSQICHGLYWRTVSHTEFCFHSAETAHECPVIIGYEVTLGEAAEFVHQLSRETTTTTRRPRQRQGFAMGDLLPALEDSVHGIAPDEDDVVVTDREPRINTNIRPLVEQ